MKIAECNREQEVIEAVRLERWPESCSVELRSHVTSCSVCTEVLAVACALREDYDEVSAEVRLPSAGLVWWRAELRARREAIRKVERPLTLVHAFSVASALGVLIAVLSTYQLSPWIQEVILLGEQHLTLVLSLAAFVLLAPIALYFVFSDK